MKNISNIAETNRNMLIDPGKAIFRKAKKEDIGNIEYLKEKTDLKNSNFKLEEIINHPDKYHIQVIEQDNIIVAYFIFEKTSDGYYEIVEKYNVPCIGRGRKMIMPFCENLNSYLAKLEDFEEKKGNLCEICQNLIC